MTNIPLQQGGRVRFANVRAGAGIDRTLLLGTLRKLHIVLTSLSVCLYSGASSAQPVRLRYEAPIECPNKNWVMDRVASLVQHQPSSPIVAVAAITRRGAVYHLELQVDGGSRRIASDSCDSLVQTLVVILSLASEPRTPTEGSSRQDSPSANGEALDATHASTSLTETQSPALSTTAAPPAAVPMLARPNAVAVVHRQENLAAPVATRQSTKVELPQDLARPHLHPTLLLWTEYGMLPHLAHGPHVGFWLDYDVWSLSVAAQWLLPQWAPMPGGDERGGYLSYLGGQIGICRLLLQPRMVGACAGIEGGDMMGKGSGVANEKLGHGVWLAGTADLTTRLGIWAKMSADLRLGLALPVKRPAFGFDNYSWKFEPLPWSLRLASGFSWF